MPDLEQAAACDLCAYAKENPEAGRFDRGCRQCRVRHASQANRERRDELVSAEPEALRESFLADVVSEFHRRQAWKRAR